MTRFKSPSPRWRCYLPLNTIAIEKPLQSIDCRGFFYGKFAYQNLSLAKRATARFVFSRLPNDVRRK